MRKINFYSAFLSLFCFSCSNKESETEEKSNKTLLIEQKLHVSKFNTIGHNIMLERVYNALEKDPKAISENPLHNERALDSCINFFIEVNKDLSLIEGVSTRNPSSAFPSFSFLKNSILDNFALKDHTKITRTSHNDETKQPDFLIMFYNEFFKSKDIIKDSLKHEVLVAIDKVMSSYPNLTGEELDGLFFVAGVTYNSCIYWNENSDKWVSVLSQNKRQNTRAHWLVQGVKNGTKKWARADSSGAIAIWSANKFVGLGSGGYALLAGAAANSIVEAWNNLPFWD